MQLVRRAKVMKNVYEAPAQDLHRRAFTDDSGRCAAAVDESRRLRELLLVSLEEATCWLDRLHWAMRKFSEKAD